MNTYVLPLFFFSLFPSLFSRPPSLTFSPTPSSLSTSTSSFSLDRHVSFDHQQEGSPPRRRTRKVEGKRRSQESLGMAYERNQDEEGWSSRTQEWKQGVSFLGILFFLSFFRATRAR